MTHNQIEYQKLEEDRRHNAATEFETRRNNVAVLGETNRHNLVYEQETGRHNRADEAIRSESNQINKAHFERSDFENSRHNQATETETNRHNLVTESQTDRAYNETVRHNVASEGIGWAQAHASMANANAALQNAATNARNADINAINATTGLINAESQRKIADAAAGNANVNWLQYQNQAENSKAQRELWRSQTALNSATTDIQSSIGFRNYASGAKDVVNSVDGVVDIVGNKGVQGVLAGELLQ